jgi:hypothetical protein
MSDEYAEVKQLKSLVRNIVDPSRDLGHVDRALSKQHKGAETAPEPATVTNATATSSGDVVPARITVTDGNTPVGEREGKSGETACEDCQ